MPISAVVKFNSMDREGFLHLFLLSIHKWIQARALAAGSVEILGIRKGRA